MKQIRSSRDRLNTRERARGTSSGHLRRGDDNDGTDEFLRNTCCSLHKRVTESLAESPPVSAQAVTKICHRFIRTSTLHLKIRSFLGLALGARQDTLILFIILRLGHRHCHLPLSNLSLRLTLGSIGPHLTWCQRLELLGLHLLEHVWVVLEVVENTEQTLFVSPPEQSVFPRRLFILVSVFVQEHLSFSVCHRPVVHRELCIPWLDAFSWIKLLKLSPGVITKSMFRRHFG